MSGARVTLVAAALTAAIAATAVAEPAAAKAPAPAAPRRWRQVATRRVGAETWTVSESPSDEKHCVAGGVKVRVERAGAAPIERVLDGDCGPPDEPDGTGGGVWEVWRLHELLAVDGKGYVVLYQQGGAYDHGGIDYWLYTVACGRLIEVAKVAAAYGFEARHDPRSFAGRVRARGPLGLGWIHVTSDGDDYYFDPTQCAFGLSPPGDE